MSESDDDLQHLAHLLIMLGMSGTPVVIYDPKTASESIDGELNTMAAALSEGPVAVLAIGEAILAALGIRLPQDTEAVYRAGHPVAVQAFLCEQRPPQGRHRPEDTAILAAAKAGHAVEVFRLVEIYAAAERAGRSPNRAITQAQAMDQAKVAMGLEISGSSKKQDLDAARRVTDGLIDRGRRIAAAFYGTKLPKDRPHADARETVLAIDAAEASSATAVPDGRAKKISRVQTSAIELVRALAGHVRRTTVHERAMASWSSSVRAGEPIAAADARDICNAHLDRMTAPDLVRVAIATDTNPADTHRHLSTMRRTFELGRKLGRLRRGRAITLDVDDATTLRAAIDTVRAGRLTTHADGCDHYLADVAGACHPAPHWDALLARICETGHSEVIDAKTTSGEKNLS